MQKAVVSIFNAYRQYRAVKAKSKAYRIFRYSMTAIFAAYLLTVCFPQYLFAHDVAYKGFRVYSREPLDENIHKILEDAEARLSKSSIYDGEISRRIFLTNGFKMHAFLTNKAFRSFASSVSGIDNIYVNKSDAAHDLVFVNRPENNSRSLSGVIAHEVTHLFIRKRVGFARTIFSLPTWKSEGYCEYIAGDTTITYAEGVKRWKENPNNDAKYRYFKYQLMVTYLLEIEKLTIDEIFNRDFDEQALAAQVFRQL